MRGGRPKNHQAQFWAGIIPPVADHVKTQGLGMSYHNRNVPVLSNMEMSLGCRFTMPMKTSAFSFVGSGFFSTDDRRRECTILVSGMGARGKGQRWRAPQK